MNIALSAALALVGVGCSTPGSVQMASPRPTPASAAPSEYAVYRVVIRYLAGLSRPNTILVLDSAVTSRSREAPPDSWWLRLRAGDSTQEFLGSYFPFQVIAKRDSSLLAPFLQANAAWLRLDADSLPTDPQVILVARDALSEAEWAALPRRYDTPSPIIHLSRVGFSADGTRAVVDVGMTAGPASGSERYCFLERTAAGGWVLSWDFVFVQS